ncbi:MAG: tetratricopeptide repeat protein [Candidatus Firestonebacteria bacterium]|nr:tetratricopeptide repeat protein [Candidatus Firestonebacteria bacterium]
MPEQLLRHRHVRWLGQTVFGVLIFSILVLLFMPPAWESSMAAVSVLGAALFGLGALFWLGEGSADRLRETSFGPAYLLLLAVWGISAMGATDKSLSLNTLAVTLSLCLVFFLALFLTRSLRHLRQYLSWLLLAAVLLSIFGLYQYAGGLSETYTNLFGGQAPQGFFETELAGRLLSGRAFSLFVYPNVFSGFLAMLLPLGLMFWISARRAGASWWWGSVLVILLAGLFSTQSLGGWMSAAIGVGLFYILLADERSLHNGHRWSLGLWFIGLLFFLGGLWLMLNHRGPGAAWDGLSQRWVHWKIAGAMFLKHPWFGVGPGLYGTEYVRFQAADEMYSRYAHNVLLQIGAETGGVGLASLGFFLFRWGQYLRRGLASWKHHPRRIYLVGLAAALAAAGAHALGDVDFHFIKNAVVVMLLAGMLTGLLRPVEKPLSPAGQTPAVPPSKTSQALAAGFTWGFGGVLLLALWRGGHSLLLEGVVFWSLGLLGMIWMVTVPLAGRMARTAFPLRWWLAFFWVWGIVSAAASLHPAAAIPGLTLGLAGLAVLSLCWAWAPQSFNLLWILVGSSLLLALLALAWVWGNPGTRVSLFWPNPNLLAAYLAMGFVTCLGLAALLPWERVRRWLLGGAAGVIGLGLLATGSFGGLLNLLAGLSVLLLWTLRRRLRLWPFLTGAAVLFLALAWALPWGPGTRWHKPGDYAGPAYERVHMASAAMQMGGDYPLTGVGPGNFRDMFERYSFPNVRGLARYGKVADFAHSEPLQILAVLGIPGLAVLLVIIGLAAVRAKELWSAFPADAPWSFAEAAPVVASAALLGAMVQGLVDFNWHAPALWLWSMALLGLMFVKKSQPSALSPVPSVAGLAAALRRPRALILLLVGASALLGATRPLLSAYYLAQGEAQQYKKKFKSADLEYQRALVVHPFSSDAYDRLGQTQADFYATTGAEHWFSLAEWAYTKALRLNGLDPYIHRHLGQLYNLKAAHLSGSERQRYYLQAMNQYREAQRKAPHQAFLMFELGNVARGAGLFSEAEDSWRRAVELEPHYAAAWSNLGVIQEIRADFPAAEASYRRALDLKQLSRRVQDKYEIELLAINWTVVHHNLAQLLERQRRWREAREQYEEVLRLEPENIRAKKHLQILGKK